MNGKSLEEDLMAVLKCLNCPFKLSKSAIKALSTPHGFPQLLAVMGWLVQVAEYNDHLESGETTGGGASLQGDVMMAYVMESYGYYMRGEDELMAAVDEEFAQKLQSEKDAAIQKNQALENEIKELEKELESYRSGPTLKEVLEKEKTMLEEDVKKFQDYIKDLTDGTAMMEKALEDKEKELAALLEEKRLRWEENEELKRRIETQGISSRDAERMKKEIQGLEKEIAETDASCNEWEEKCWDLDSRIGQQLKELEMRCFEGNDALKKLKLDADFQYKLNPKGSTPIEVLGLDFKSTVGPMLESLAMKHSSKDKLEELVEVQKQAAEMNSRIQAKKNRLKSLESHIEEVENQIVSIKKEMQESSSRYAAEAKRMMEDVEKEILKMERMEKEALDTLKVEELKYRETVKQTDEEVQLCANELLATIDSISKFKQRMDARSAEMKMELAETAEFVSNIYKSTISLSLSTPDAPVSNSNSS